MHNTGLAACSFSLDNGRCGTDNFVELGCRQEPSFDVEHMQCHSANTVLCFPWEFMSVVDFVLELMKIASTVVSCDLTANAYSVDAYAAILQCNLNKLAHIYNGNPKYGSTLAFNDMDYLNCSRKYLQGQTVSYSSRQYLTEHPSPWKYRKENVTYAVTHSNTMSLKSPRKYLQGQISPTGSHNVHSSHQQPKYGSSFVFSRTCPNESPRKYLNGQANDYSSRKYLMEQNASNSYVGMHDLDSDNFNTHCSNTTDGPRKYLKGPKHSCFPPEAYSQYVQVDTPSQCQTQGSYQVEGSHTAQLRVIKRCFLNRAFRLPVSGPNGMLIFDIVVHESYVKVTFVRRNKSYIGCFNGKLSSLIIASCLKAAPIGELAKGLLSFRRRACLSKDGSLLRSTPDGGRVASRDEGISRVDSRRSYRKWKGLSGEVERRVLLGQSPPSLITHSGIAQSSRGSLSARHSDTQDIHVTQSQRFKEVILPSLNSVQGNSKAPKLSKQTTVCISTFNVEGLKELGKHSQLVSYMKSKNISILAIQETHISHSDTFVYEGYKFYLSGTKNDNFAGVGFIVSPSMNIHVRGFKPVSSRIAILRVAASPRSLEIYSIYAPSQLSSGENSVALDLERKQGFWDDMNSFCNTQSPYFPIIVGDFNARWEQDDVIHQLGKTNPYVGQHHFGAPPADTQYTNNSSFLFDFLTESQMYVPSSFHYIKPHKRITYREIHSDSYANSLNPQPVDWSELDLVLFPLHSRSTIPNVSSDSSFMFGSRHFPVSFTFKMNKCPKVFLPRPVHRYNTPTYEQITLYHDSLKQQLGIPQDKLDDLPKVEIYTDGSCPDNRNVHRFNPAGWGFTFRYMDSHSDWHDSYGPVSTFTDDVWYVGAKVGSNNTAELTALIEAIDCFLRFPTFALHLQFYVDSQYAIDVLLGTSAPIDNILLVSNLRSHFSILSSRFPTSIFKVQSHVGIEGNERADTLAAQGVLSTSFLQGRFLQSPPDFLLPSAIYQSPSHSLSSIEQHYSSLMSCIKHSSSTHLQQIKVKRKQKYVSADTISLIAQRNSLVKSDYRNRQEFNIIRSKIRKSLKKDKQAFVKEALDSDFRGGPAEKWQQIKRLRTVFTPHPPAVKDPSGKVEFSDRKPDILAEYLSTNVWNQVPDYNLLPTPMYSLHADISPFSYRELVRVVSRLRSGRSPGSDEIRCELLKWSPYELHQELLLLINKCFLSCEVPKQWQHSIVVMLPKPNTQDPLSPASYRPISLTQSMYKVYATLLRTRLQSALEPLLRPSQFGFRPARSTHQPIFLLRRTLELFERSSSSLHCVFLDWSKAFDSITHLSILHALHFYGVPEPLIQAVFSLYSDSSFQVRNGQALSHSHPQQRGVRQGCPLSPYLFIVVLSHIMTLADQEYEEKYGSIPGVFSASSPLWDLEYADDTVIVTRTSETAQRFLDILLPIAFSKGLSINASKCEHLRVHSDEDVWITNPSTHERTVMEVSTVVKYLGVLLSPNSSSNVEVNRRISQANASFKLLKPFLKQKSLPVKWRLSVYNQILRAILCYGLDSLSLDQTNFGKLDSFHFKVLRTCFGIKSSFYHKILADTGKDCTNFSLHKLADNLHLTIPTPSQYLQDASLKLFGHVLRHPEELSHKVLFGSCNQTRTLRGSCRSGQPRLHWLENMLTLSTRRLEIAESGSLPKVGLLLHPYFAKVNKQEISSTLGTSIFDRIDITSTYRKIAAASTTRTWHRITHTLR